MGGRGRDLFLTHAKTETRARGRKRLADLRLTLAIFAWFDPSAKIREAANTGCEEIDMEQRASSRAVGFSALKGLLAPGQDMANFFSAELERCRIARPPYAPYVVTDSLSAHPWLPAGETRVRPLGKWQANQRTSRRHTGKQDRNIGKFVLYRMRYVLTGDLVNDWSDFGGITAHLNHLAVVLGLSITDHAGLAATYDFRTHRAIQKMSKNRPARTDYFEFLSTANKDIRADIMRDFEARTDEIKKEKEKGKINEREIDEGEGDGQNYGEEDG